MNSDYIRDFKGKQQETNSPHPHLNRILQRNYEKQHHKSHEVLKIVDDPSLSEGEHVKLDRKDSTKRNSRSEENLLGMCQKKTVAAGGQIILTQDFFKVSKEISQEI